jgi:hypothetical protein
VAQISAGEDHGLALLGDGSAAAWGDNAHGEIGIGSQGDPVTMPVRVKALPLALDVDAGLFTSGALLSDGTVSAWGEIGDRPQPIPGLVDVEAISVGGATALALLGDGTVATFEA